MAHWRYWSDHGPIIHPPVTLECAYFPEPRLRMQRLGRGVVLKNPPSDGPRTPLPSSSATKHSSGIFLSTNSSHVTGDASYAPLPVSSPAWWIRATSG